MKWTEGSESGVKLHVLTLEGGDTVEKAMVPFLVKALEYAASADALPKWQKIGLEMLFKEIKEDVSGALFLKFTDNRMSACKGLDKLEMRSENEFTCLEGDKDNDAFEREKLVLLLKHIKTAKNVFESKDVAEPMKRIKTARKLCVEAGTYNGWFDLKLGSKTFGALDENDQRLLAGQKTVPEDILSVLTAGTVRQGAAAGTFELEDAD